MVSLGLERTQEGIAEGEKICSDLIHIHLKHVVVLANRKQKQTKNSLDLNWENICVKSPRHIVIGKTPIK